MSSKKILFSWMFTFLASFSYSQQNYYSCVSYNDGFDEIFTHIRLTDQSLYINGYQKEPVQACNPGALDNILYSIQLYYAEFNYNQFCNNQSTTIPWTVANGLSVSVFLMKGSVDIDTVTLGASLSLSSANNDLNNIGTNYSLPSWVVADDDYRLRFEIILSDAGYDFIHTITTDPFVVLCPVNLLSPYSNELDLDFQNPEFVWNLVDSASYYNLFITESANGYGGGSCTGQIPPPGYEVWVQGITDTTYVVNGLQPNTEYIWMIWAIQFGECAICIDTFTTRNFSAPISRYDFYETVPSNSSNPENLVNIGDSIRFNVRIINELSQNLPTLEGRLEVITPGVTLIDSIVSFNNVSSGTDSWSSDFFEIFVDTTVNSGTELEFILETDDQIISGGPWTSQFSFPIEPMVKDTILLDDDSNPDSMGDDDQVPEPGETVELLPILRNISIHDFYEVSGKLNCSNSSISIWDNVMGASGIVYDSVGYNFVSNNQFPILVNDQNILPEFDYVFDYQGTSSLEELNFTLVLYGYIDEQNGGVWDQDGVLMKWGVQATYNDGQGTNTLVEQRLAGYKVYPNPFNENLFIKCPEKTGAYDLKIVDPMGTVVLDQQSVSSELFALNVAELAHGMYFVIITELNGRAIVPVVIGKN